LCRAVLISRLNGKTKVADSKGSIFWRASFLSAAFASATLFFVGMPLKVNPLALAVCLVNLAFSSAFIDAALLPDVFSFHALLISLLGSLYLYSQRHSKIRTFGIPFLFSLGLAHHLTVVFTLPVLLAVAFESRTDQLSTKRVLFGLLSGLSLTFMLYCSLFLCHPTDPLSWGNLNSASSLLRHLLRVDYGVLSLAPEGNPAAFQSLRFVMSSSGFEIGGLLVLSVLGLIWDRNVISDSRLRVWALTCLTSLSFLALSNVSPNGMGSEVLKRFHVMPLLAWVMLCGFILHKIQFNLQRTFIACILIVPEILYLVAQPISLKDYHEDSVMEDYAINSLNEAALHSSSIILTSNENAYFGIRYSQSVLGVHPEIAVISPSLLFHPWYAHKIKEQLPIFELRNQQRVWDSRNLDLIEDVIQPNLPHSPIYVHQGYQDGLSFQVTFLALGRILKEGRGVSFDQHSLAISHLRTRYEVPPSGPQAWSRALLFSHYSYFYLAQAKVALSKGEKAEAISNWRSALHQVPYAFPALQNLCRIIQAEDPRCNPTYLEKIRNVSWTLF